MPHVSVKMYAGRASAQKAALADAITRAVTNTLGDKPDSISVAIEDVASSTWMETVYGPEIEGTGDRLFKRPGYGPLAQQEGR